MRRAAKVDTNQKQIVKDLRKVGYSVLVLSRVGDGCPDIMVGTKNINYLFEIKDGKKSKSRKKLTNDQVDFFESWKGQVHKVESTEEIIKIISDDKILCGTGD